MKVVKVLWVDSCNSNMNWTVAEDIEIEPMYIDSFGVVVKDTDEFLAIAQNYGDNPEQYSNITTIPKDCIKEVFVIYKDNVCENEQKPADKVEPKFHEGDWVVKGDVIAQILDVQEQYYVGLDTEGKDFTASRFLSNDKIHLWTIDDAKAGDVLVTDSGRPFIFKGCLDKIHPNNPVAYCGIDNGDDFYECSGINWWTDENVYPATQEQRDLLFQKMKEAGYEWDADKKELKKIEQKPWSEEDEKMFEHIIAKATLHFSSINYLDEEEINFLKSLKDRVQPQLKQEWSEDDEQYLLVCKNALRKYQVTDKWDSNIISQWLDNKLKSLRPQSTWKPCDEQIEALEHFVRSVGESGYASPYDNNTKLLYSLLSDLKKLKG